MIRTLAALAVVIVAAGLLVGPAPLSPAEVVSALSGAGSDQTVMIVREIRLPRTIAAFLVGAALAAAGAALQGLLRNPLADPGVLGVSAASALAAVVAIYFGFAAAAPFVVPAAAMLGALGATALLHALASRDISTERLILVGVGLSSACGALTALAMNLAPNPFVLSDLVNWLFGAVSNRSVPDILVALPPLALGAALVAAAAPGLTALSLGDDAAASVGADLVAIRWLTIGGAALLVGASVALAGVVGFVGVVAPHLARPLVRHDPGRVMVPAALVGGAMLAAADLAVRLLPFSQELKLGVAAALVGAPAFIWIAARTQRLAP